MGRRLCLFGRRRSHTCAVGDTEFREESTGRSLIDKRGSDSVILLAITTEPTRHLAAERVFGSTRTGIRFYVTLGVVKAPSCLLSQSWDGWLAQTSYRALCLRENII